MNARAYFKIVTKCWSNQIKTQLNKTKSYAIFPKLCKQIDINIVFHVKVKNVEVKFQKNKIIPEFPLLSHNFGVTKNFSVS